jgi:beta-barrel assembly-enhancing protease
VRKRGQKYGVKQQKILEKSDRNGKGFADRFNSFGDSIFGELLEEVVDHFGMLAALAAIFLSLGTVSKAQERVNPFAEPWKFVQDQAEMPQFPAALGQTRVPQELWELTRVQVAFVMDELPQSDAVAEVERKVAKPIPKKYDVNKIGERGTGGGLNFYSTNREIELGKRISADVEREAKMFRDHIVGEYVNRLVQNLVRSSDAKVPFTVKIIDSDEVNAFALPGGFMYVNTGLLMATENEAELAGVLAHEIAHVAARHATKSATKQEIFNLATIPLIFLGGPAGVAVRNVAQIAVPMSFMKFSRNAEREADLLGIEYQYSAGYDPAAMVNFFEKLKSQERQKKNFLAKAFSTHPMNEDRLKRAQKTIETMLPERDQYLLTSSEFDEMRARLQSLLRGRMIISAPVSDKPVLRKSTAKNSF